MRSFMWLGCGIVALVVAARGGSSPATKSASGLGLWPNSGNAATEGAIEVFGVTQCVPGRRASIAPVPLHPVVDVKVVPGDYVKKGQLLVKLDDDEARADVRAKKAQLESAQYSAAEARRFLAKARAKQAVLPEQRLHEAELAVRKSEADERAARAALDSSEAELEHFSVTAVIDGIVSWLDVYPGVVSRPGTSLWGEIVDLRELDVRCEVTSEQADEVSLGEPVELKTSDGKHDLPLGRVIYIAPVADPKTKQVPILVRIHNRDQRVRSGISVAMRFAPLGVDNKSGVDNKGRVDNSATAAKGE